MKLINSYYKALSDIYKHVGFQENRVVYPICDYTNIYWSTDGDIVRVAKRKKLLKVTAIQLLQEQEIKGSLFTKHGNDEINADELKEQLNNFSTDLEIDKLWCYDKWIFEGKELTLIFIETERWFAIFDNKKRGEHTAPRIPIRRCEISEEALKLLDNLIDDAETKTK